MEGNKDPEARGRELGITRQLLSKVPATGFPTQGWQGSRKEASKTYFSLASETFCFQNGLRSDRNATRHAVSLNAEGLQCVL